MGEKVEAGWYDDGTGRHRWFDGTGWTDRYMDAERPGKSPPPPNPAARYNPKMDAASAPSLQPKKTGIGALWGCLGCIGLVGGAFVVFSVLGTSAGSDYDPNNKYEAISQCEARVEKLLKAPATAEFDSDATGSATWTVSGTVDSENGFGALVRSDFQCTVVIAGDTATTTVDYLE